MFQKLSWTGQLLAGITLFGVSFALEAMVLTAYLGSPVLGCAVAGGLEASKVLSIVIYRILREQTEAPYPWSVRGAALLFRTFLFVLSAGCSVMFLAEQLDRPQLDAVRAADIAQANASFQRDLERATKTHARRREQAEAQLAADAEHRRRGLSARLHPVVNHGLVLPDILIDITGGQKPNAVAGTAVALAEGRRIQYVACARDTGECRVTVYDVTYDA